MATLTFKAELAKVDESKVDPTMVLSRAKVVAARADSSGRVYRVYCDGVFDLFHLAHMRMFEQAKKALGPADKVHLIAGVCSDELGTLSLSTYRAGHGSASRLPAYLPAPLRLPSSTHLPPCPPLSRLLYLSPPVQGQDGDEPPAAL